MLGKSFTRLSVLPDNRKLLLGIDKDNIFEPGIVYEVHKILDEIILRPVGKYSLPKTGYPSELSEVNAIVYSGHHLITEDELKEINNGKG